jgi:hypothetical protein
MYFLSKKRKHGVEIMALSNFGVASPKCTTASVSERKQLTFLLAERDRPGMSRYLVRVPRFNTNHVHDSRPADRTRCKLLHQHKLQKLESTFIAVGFFLQQTPCCSCAT